MYGHLFVERDQEVTSVRVYPALVDHLWYPILVNHHIVEMRGSAVNEWNERHGYHLHFKFASVTMNT